MPAMLARLRRLLMTPLEAIDHQLVTASKRWHDAVMAEQHQAERAHMVTINALLDNRLTVTARLNDPAATQEMPAIRDGQAPS